MNTLEMFEDWSARHHTHVDRHILILNKQAESLRSYIELIRSRPVNDDEFLTEILKIHGKLVTLIDELGEINLSFIQDCDDFRDILDSLKQDFLKVKK